MPIQRFKNSTNQSCKIRLTDQKMLLFEHYASLTINYYFMTGK